MKIIVLDGYALNPGDLSWDELEKLGDVRIFNRTSPESIVEHCADAQIVLTNKTPLSRETLDKLPALKYIGVLATGYNVIDVDRAREKNIVVTNVPGYGTTSVVQMTFALLLELCQHVQRHSDAVMNGRWVTSKDWCFWDYPLIELCGKTMGIIGFGTIGQKVANVAEAFGMNILAVSRTKTDQSHRINFKWRDIPELLSEADVVSLHCPLTTETKGLINKDSLQKMKRSAFLLNTSRGPLVMDQDLADALNDDVIGGAALDVLSTEPPQKENPLFKAKNCIITPHIAWATREARQRLMATAVNNVTTFLRGKPENIVNGLSPFV